MIYDQELADGTLLSYEANPPNVHLNWFSSWAGVAGFDAIRFDDIEAAASDLGSLSNPILIGSYPYQDTRDTSDSPSDLLDACGTIPGTDESGREYVYAITIDQPGQLSAAVSDGMGVDIDLHLYEHASERDCVARHDNMLDLSLSACGTYLLVLDTWVNAAGDELQGPYTLTVDFTPSGGACQPFGDYEYMGGPGDACAYPNSAALPFCNPNLDVLTCLYSTGADPFSFCTRACASDSDCTSDFPDGCCEPISGGDHYCFPSEYCAVVEPDGGVDGGVDGGEDGGVEPTDSGPGADGYDPVDAGGDDPIDAGGDEPFDAGADQAADSDNPDAGNDAGLDAGEDAGADPNPQDKDQAPADGSSCPEGYELYEGACVPLGWRPEDPGGCSCHSTAKRSAPLSLLLGLLLIGLRRRAS